MSAPPWHSLEWALEWDPERDPMELVMAVHRKGQTMMSILSKVRLSAALEHGWGVHVPKLGSESCCESHCGWFCISLPTSGRTDMNPPDTDGMLLLSPGQCHHCIFTVVM